MLILLIFLIGCGGEETAVTPTPNPTDTPEPIATALPTDTPEPSPMPTETPEPTAVPTITPEPTATPDPTTNFTNYVDSDLGIALQYPGDWSTATEEEDDITFLIFASNEDFVDGAHDGESGALFVVAQLGTTSPDLTAVLADAVNEYWLFGDAEMVGEETAVLIGQHPARQQRFVSETSFDGEYHLNYTAIYAFNRNYLIIHTAPTTMQETYAPILDAMTTSVNIYEPVTASTVTDDNFTTYNVNDFIAFRYPQSWVINEDLDNDIEVVISTSQELLDGTDEDSQGAAVQFSISNGIDFDYTPGDDLAETLDNIVAGLADDNSQITIVEATTQTVINGLPAATTALNVTEEQLSGYLTFAFIPYDDYVILAWGVAIGGAEAEYIPYSQSNSRQHYRATSICRLPI